MCIRDSVQSVLHGRSTCSLYAIYFAVRVDLFYSESNAADQTATTDGAPVSYTHLLHTIWDMRLRLPLSLRSALLACSVLFTTVASASVSDGTLGNVMYIGDSITHGVNSGS